VGVEDEPTDPAICVCESCMKLARDAARVAELWERERITQTMTVVNAKREVRVYVVRRGTIEGGGLQTLEGNGSTQLEAIEDAIARGAA